MGDSPRMCCDFCYADHCSLTADVYFLDDVLIRKYPYWQFRIGPQLFLMSFFSKSDLSICTLNKRNPWGKDLCHLNICTPFNKERLWVITESKFKFLQKFLLLQSLKAFCQHKIQFRHPKDNQVKETFSPQFILVSISANINKPWTQLKACLPSTCFCCQTHQPGKNKDPFSPPHLQGHLPLS